jgi:hypothetical protein
MCLNSFLSLTALTSGGHLQILPVVLESYSRQLQNKVLGEKRKLVCKMNLSTLN